MAKHQQHEPYNIPNRLDGPRVEGSEGEAEESEVGVGQESEEESPPRREGAGG